MKRGEITKVGYRTMLNILRKEEFGNRSIGRENQETVKLKVRNAF